MLNPLLIALLALLLAACGGGPAAVTVTVKTSTGLPVGATFVAFQDGDGPWQTISDLGSPSYSFQVKSGRYGVAIACAATGSSAFSQIQNFVLYRSTGDTADVLRRCSTSGQTTFSLSGTISGVGAGQTAEVWLGGIKRTTSPFSYNMAAGTYDLLGLRRSAGVADVALLKRGVVLSANKTENFDFASSEAFAVAAKALSISNSLASETAKLEMAFFSDKVLGATLASANAISLSAPAIPISKQIEGDYHRITASTLNATAGTERYTYRYTKEVPDALALELPPLFSSPVLGLTAAPNPRPSVGWTTYPETKEYTLSASQFTSSKGLLWLVFLSPAWLASKTSYTFPDLSALPGWDKAWEFTSGTEVSLNFSAGQSDAPGNYFATLPKERTDKIAGKTVAITP
jgi:hypothetical protein